MKRALFWLLPVALAATGLQAQWTDDPQTNTEIAVKAGSLVQAKFVASPYGGGFVSWMENTGSGFDVNPDGSLGAPTTAPGTGGPQLLMRSGPGSAFQVPLNTTWSSKTPAINDAGRVAMSVNSVAGTGNAGVWSGDRNGGGIIDTAADASALYTDVDINNAGQVAWIRRESAQNGILRYDPISGETEFLTNAPLGASSWTAISINNSGQVGYRAGFGFAGNAWVSYDANTGAAVHLAEDGVDSNSPYVFLFTPAFNDQRRIAGRADLGAVGNSQIVVVDPDGTIQVLAEVNALDPDSPFTSFRNSVGLNGLGQVAFMAALSGGGTGVFVADGDGIQQYALEGEDGLASIEFFGPAINNTGGVVFRGFNDQGDRAIWYADGEQVIAVATRGDEVEIDVGTAILAAADAFGPTSPNFGGAPDIGDSGDITFVSLLTDPNDTSVNFGRGVFVVTVDGPREDRLFDDRFEAE